MSSSASSSSAAAAASGDSRGYFNDYDRLVGMASQSAGPDGCAQTVEDAINDKRTYIFGELLDAVHALRISQGWAESDGLPILRDKDPRIFTTLELFAYGRFSDYTANPDKYITLHETQLTKLRVLTLLTIADSKNRLSYEAIAQELGFDTTRGYSQVEDLIIDAMNSLVFTSISSSQLAPLISGTLNQKLREFTILDSLARDIDPASGIPKLLAQLEGWKKSCTSTKDTLIAYDVSLSSTSKLNEAEQVELKTKTDETIKLLQRGAERDIVSRRGIGRDLHSNSSTVPVLDIMGSIFGSGGGSVSGRRGPGPGGRM